MNALGQSIRQLFTPVKPLPSGMYHYQAPPEDPRNFRLHLRMESTGKAMLVVNASTILHLNQTAAEYAYHIIHNTPEETTAKLISNRYNVSPQKALFDFLELKETIELLATRDDLDPEIFMDLDPINLENLSKPIRLDCALTYNLPDHTNSEYSPSKRVDQELSNVEWKRILDKAWNESIPHIIFTGGEPTLRDDLEELIKYAEMKGQVTGLLSDGHKFIDKQYFDTLLNSGLDHLLFLLQPDNDLSWKGLEIALLADLFVTAHMTIAPSNASQIFPNLKKLAEMGCRSLSLSCMNTSLSKELADAQEKSAELDLKLVWDLPVPFSSFNPISLDKDQIDLEKGSRKSWLYVEPDGDVRNNQESPTVLGNFLTDSIETLWNF